MGRVLGGATSANENVPVASYRDVLKIPLAADANGMHATRDRVAARCFTHQMLVDPYSVPGSYDRDRDGPRRGISRLDPGR